MVPSNFSGSFASFTANDFPSTPQDENNAISFLMQQRPHVQNREFYINHTCHTHFFKPNVKDKKLTDFSLIIMYQEPQQPTPAVL